MSPQLLTPADAASSIARHLNKTWATRVCAELRAEPQPTYTCALRGSISGSAAVERIGIGRWHDWRMAWRKQDLTSLDGVLVQDTIISVAGQRYPAPLRIVVSHLDAALLFLERLEGGALNFDVERARALGRRLRDAEAIFSPESLKATYFLADPDIDVLVDAIVWLRENHDLSGWTTRQLPVPGMHTKWLSAHRGILRSMTGRDLSNETLPRLSVVNFTYVDPLYLATEARRHDAWTTGDNHALAYEPQTILVVENRDCRLWFPAVPGTIVVEGSGKAAASTLSRIDWIVNADRIVYWGDMDADGYSILNNLRVELSFKGIKVDSILMDAPARARYSHLGVNRDKRGDELKPSTVRQGALTPDESAGYAGVATAGETFIRRIEQERIPLEDAAAALQLIVARSVRPPT